jgi:hypothetical protein
MRITIDIRNCCDCPYRHARLGKLDNVIYHECHQRDWATSVEVHDGPIDISYPLISDIYKIAEFCPIKKQNQIKDQKISKENCPDCGRPWDDHQWGVPSPYCPTYEEPKSEGSNAISYETLKEKCEKLDKLLELSCLDWADNHTYLQKLCKQYIPEGLVEGDSNGVPGIMQLADMLNEIIIKSKFGKITEKGKQEVDLFGECKCSNRYSIEPHGSGYALYMDRCPHKHGFKLAFITEADKDVLLLIEMAMNIMSEKPIQ